MNAVGAIPFILLSWLLVVVVLYWCIRLAVRHALRDAGVESSRRAIDGPAERDGG